ncbi:hypothetical protein MAR_005601 [Mya arenaria]|uniref:SCP domain-containing protein n=1 Tax=Mya arenaria TaxID=6604 RepID=A0ABY7F357_MYAAR|nr:hypothetical protein MAR_005601 [Mya arenaria]
MNELKKRSNNWTDSERHSALSTIMNQDDSFFGKFKGATLGNKAKEAKWDEILWWYTQNCGKRFGRCTRSQSNGPEDWGGPGEQFSACDNLLLDKLKDTIVLTGIAGGVESGSYSFIIENDHDSSQPGTGACGRINENTTYEVPCVFAEEMYVILENDQVRWTNCMSWKGRESE